MENHKIIFYLLTSFIVFGGGIFENKLFNLSNISFNLAMLIPFILLRYKVQKVSSMLNKKYQLDELKNLLKSDGNLSDREIKKYVKKIDLINDIDEDGIDMVVDNLTKLACESNSERELTMILKRININNLKKNFNLFDLDIDNLKFSTIINKTLNNLNC
jgi:hypothetical protein